MRNKKASHLLHPNGSLNIKPKGISIFKQYDLHNSLITMNWVSFFFVIAMMFTSVDVIFTVIYLLLGPEQITGIVQTSFWEIVFEMFLFSTQILSTLGMSRVVPAGVASSIIAATESMLSVIFFAFVTGLSYARFARPHPKIIYSKNIAIGPYKSADALMIRAVNFKKNQLVDVTAELIFTINIRIEGKPTRFFYNLPLEQEKLGMMLMSWIIVHKITEDSPLYNLSAEDMEISDAEILVMIRGADDILSQNVFSRTSYKPSQIIWDAEFVSINELDEVGNMQIDIGRMHETRTMTGTFK